MILINKNAVLYQKIYISPPIGNDKALHDWMREIEISDHLDNQEDLKEWGRQMIREILNESCILFLEGVKEECEKHILKHEKQVNERKQSII